MTYQVRVLARTRQDLDQTQVSWFDRGSNMRRVWHSGIIDRAGGTEDFQVTDLADA